jgi:hypothetical protein
LPFAGERLRLPFWDAFPTVCAGMTFGALLLLPIHEHLHAVGYRLVGAKNTRVRYNLSCVTAQCEAPGEVVGGTLFVVVCLMPLLVLNPVLTDLALSITKTNLDCCFREPF